MTDADLLERCLAHDRDAWDAFVERFGPLAYSVIHHTLRRYSVMPGHGLVDDLFGAAFLALYDADYRKLRQWKGSCSLASWIRLVVASSVVDQLRRGRPEQPTADIEQLRDRAEALEAPDAQDLLSRASDIARVRRALARLGRRDRELLSALYVDEVPPGALAARLGIQSGALYTRKNRALGRLRAVLEADDV